MMDKEEAIKAIDDMPAIFDDAEERIVRGQCIEVIKGLQNQKGKWEILGRGEARCPRCHIRFLDVYDIDNSDNFCRNCGLDMRS